MTKFVVREVVSKFIDTGVAIASVYALAKLVEAIGDFGSTIKKTANTRK